MKFHFCKKQPFHTKKNTITQKRVLASWLISTTKHQGNIALPPMAVATCGDGWALRARIGMTINLPDHLMSVTQ